MEEVVWIFIGVIGLLIVIGSVATVYKSSVEDGKLQAAQQSAARLGEMCAKVCRMPGQTYLSVSTPLPSGGVVTAAGESICVSYSGSIACRSCGCPLQAYTLDLNNSDARKLFKTHDYDCFFLHGTQMSMECRG